MKREFGKKLIEDFFADVELTHVIDTSGAYIPGHGTPTVILFGRERTPSRRDAVGPCWACGASHAARRPGEGLVWSAIAGPDRSAGQRV